MQIYNSNTNFQGTRLKYQKFDHIMRNVNNAYPKISPYRLSMKFREKNISYKKMHYIERLFDIVDDNRKNVYFKNNENIIESDIENVRRTKLGDCGESSAITVAGLIANGIKNFKIASLYFDINYYDKKNKSLIAQKTYCTTHEFVLANLNEDAQGDNPKSYGKNTVVIDSWLNFCGNVQEAFDKFFQTFLKGKRKNETSDIEYTYKPKLYLMDLNIDVNDELIKEFKHKYPKLVVKGDK